MQENKIIFEKDFVLKVNEVFHDVEGSDYYHPEVVKQESIRWLKIGKDFFANNPKKINLLDIGSGTGFVPLLIGKFLKRGDLSVCSDISEKLLTVCKKNVIEKEFLCQTEFVKIDGKSYNFELDKFNYITLNSVLHHIPNYSTFFKEINRLLRKKGRIIISHEPNKNFSNNYFLWYNFRFLNYLYNDPKGILIAILKIFKIYKFVRKVTRNSNNNIKSSNTKLKEVNKFLLNEGVIKVPLTIDQLTEIVDINSPTAGGFHKNRGIHIPEILKRYLPNFKIEAFETYNHLGRLSYRNKYSKWYDFFLKKLFSKSGATFFAVLKKEF